MGKRIITVFIAIILVISAVLIPGCGSTPIYLRSDGNKTVNLDFKDEDFDNVLPKIQSEDPYEIKGYNLVAENEYLQLYFSYHNEELNRAEAAIAVRDRSNGYVWYSSVPDHKYPAEKKDQLPPLQKDGMRSLFLIHYSILNNDDTTIYNEAIMDNDLAPEIKFMAIENGVRIKYYIKNFGFNMVIEARIIDDSLEVTIPYQAIEEEIGMTEWLEGELKAIDEYIDKLEAVIKELKGEKAVIKFPQIKKRVREIENSIQELKQLLRSIDGPLGINDISQAATKVMNKLKSYLQGGVNITGLQRMINHDEAANIDKEIIAKYDKLLGEIKDMQRITGIKVTNLQTKQFATISKIELMPYFGACNDTDDGYVFFPDGSGAISYFKEDHPANWSDHFNRDVYTEAVFDLDWEKVRDNSGMKRVFLPVYGIKDGENAFVATITEGDANSLIHYAPSGFVFYLNRVYPEFYIKNTIQQAATKSGGYGRPKDRLERSPIPTNYTIKYMFLSGDKADYGGMASRYREYLFDTGEMKKSDNIKDKVPVTIDLLMGIKEERILMDKFIPMTTFEEAENLIQYLHDNGVEHILLNLHGWTKDGYNRYPSSSVPAPRLGGVKGLKKLMETAKKTGTKVYLQDNYIEIYRSLGDVNTKTTAVDSRGRMYYNSYRRINVYSPRYINKEFKESILPKIEKYGVDGISFERLSSFIYLDYQEDQKFQRMDTIEFFRDMMAESSKKLGGAVAIRPNKYVLKYSDWLMELPSGSTNYLYADKEIPFYQMVVHGVIPYSSSSLYNQFFDRKMQTLKMIEYGSAPFFRLTSLNPRELKETGYDSLFSSEIDDWKDDIVRVYKEFNENLSFMADNYMVKHEFIDRDLVRVVYSDGSEILLNYAQVDKVYNNHTVKAMDYLVIN